VRKNVTKIAKEDQKQQTEEDIWKQEDQELDIFLNSGMEDIGENMNKFETDLDKTNIQRSSDVSNIAYKSYCNYYCLEYT